MSARAVAAVAAAVGLAFAGMQVPAQGAAVHTVHMAPNASGDGSAKRPAGSLAAAQAAIKKAGPNRNVEVRIRPGTYTADPGTRWDTYIKGRTISFLPDGPGRPVFVSSRKPGKVDGPWLKAVVPDKLGFNAGRLQFRHLEIRGYTGGIALDGGAAKSGGTYVKGPGLYKNVVEDMVFRNLGDVHTGGAHGYGAVILTNASGTMIRKNTFVNIENEAPQGTKIHGVYVTHFSNNNKVLDNTFTRVSGDPVKFRDQSNNNTISGNTFTRAGHYSYYREEFCAAACLKKNAGKPRECASGNNRFYGNKQVSGYKGKKIPTYTLEPRSNTDKGPAACPPLAGGKRIKLAK